MLLLSLIGEQPIPNLLVARALQPKRHLLCHTFTTQRVAANLAAMLPNAEECAVEPYDLPKTLEQMGTLCTEETIINLTGGTKPMALAAYEIARQMGLPFVYLQSEGKQNVLYEYGWQNGKPQRQRHRVLGTLITIADYLKAHGLQPFAQKGPQNSQESGLRQWLERQVDECCTNLVFAAFEVDFILRRGNQVAIAEAKDRKANKRQAIDLLNTIAGREYLGTYTGKILITRQPLGSQLRALAEARQVRIVQVGGRTNPQSGRLDLDDESKDALRRALDEVLGSTPHPRSTLRGVASSPNIPPLG